MSSAGGMRLLNQKCLSHASSWESPETWALGSGKALGKLTSAIGLGNTEGGASQGVAGE